jgi:hypothetical protein
MAAAMNGNAITAILGRSIEPRTQSHRPLQLEKWREKVTLGTDPFQQLFHTPCSLSFYREVVVAAIVGGTVPRLLSACQRRVLAAVLDDSTLDSRNFLSDYGAGALPCLAEANKRGQGTSLLRLTHRHTELLSIVDWVVRCGGGCRNWCRTSSFYGRN